MIAPNDDSGDETQVRDENWPSFQPDHPSFGPESSVKVYVPSEILLHQKEEDQLLSAPSVFSRDGSEGRRRSGRNRMKGTSHKQVGDRESTSRRPVKERWYYEPVSANVANVLEDNEDMDLDDGTEEMIKNLVRAEDKYEVAIAMQPEAVYPWNHSMSFTGSASKNSQLPSSLGSLEPILGEDLDSLQDNEIGACFLQGTLFYDEELEWCMVSG